MVVADFWAASNNTAGQLGQLRFPGYWKEVGAKTAENL